MITISQRTCCSNEIKLFHYTIRKYTFNIGYLEHSTSVLKLMLKVTMLNV